MSLNLTTIATIIGLAKRPGQTRDGRAVLSLNVEIDGTTYELNIVTKQGQGIEQALNYLANAKYLAKNGNKFTIEVPTWTLAKAKGNVVWVHVEDYEKLKGTT
ncbi:MAG: hypothetical protein GU355_06955 [Caldivirga sp.]|jgi:hypothetical protein|nr:hypothetical protein [Caldivirga sp.]